MAPRTTSGSGRAQGKGRAEGRTAKTASPGGVGRYTSPEQSGRYTRPIPKKVRTSPRWFGPTILLLFVVALLMIILNYITVLPGSVSTWYLVSGIVLIAIAFGMATRYR
jgi:hypothetical protein